VILDYCRDAVILFTGSQDERAGIDIAVGAVNSRQCVNVAGHTTIPDLPILYSVSSFMLTNDSGPAHFASITDMPTFVFFGPETPKLYGPLGKMTPIYSGLACSPCVSAANHRKSVCNDNVCLQVITPEQVFQILLPSLELLRR
jgi:ADP-heptose:LPS heptosyltransferase